MAAYLNKGYLTASFAAKTVPLKNDPHKVEVIYSITEGPQVHAVAVETIGANNTRPQIIARNAKIPVGKPLSETELLESESKLYTLGVFDWASVDPRTPLTNDSAQVLIKVHEAKRNDLTYGVGFEVTNRGWQRSRWHRGIAEFAAGGPALRLQDQPVHILGAASFAGIQAAQLPWPG